MEGRRRFIPSSSKLPDIYREGWIDFNKNGVLDPYEDPSRPVDERVEDLLSRMTLEEKLEVLRVFKRVGRPLRTVEEVNEAQRRAVEESRLGIPLLLVTECLHGCMAFETTQFPQAIALAATWDPDLVYKVAKAIAKETRAKGFRQCFSPVVNLARDVRCGRTEETYGEDPYLASLMARSFCKALREEGVIATPKHFAANYIADGGRDSHEAHLSERILRETELQPFYAGVKAGALSIMAAYNSLDGVPCSCNRWLLTDVLRREWGFEGFVVSDAWAVPGLIAKHRVAARSEEAVALCLKAGLEVELPTVFWDKPLEDALKAGLIAEEDIDEAVRRVLKAMFAVGLFDEPYVNPEEAAKTVGCEEHVQLAYEAARKAIVLLKNEGGVLPIDRGKIRHLLVLGGAAKTLKLGGYSGVPKRVATPLEAIREKLAGSRVELEYLEVFPVEMGCDNAIQIRNPNTGFPLLRTRYVAPPEGYAGEGVRIEIFDNPSFEGKPAADFVGFYWVGFRYEWGYGKPHEAVKSDNYSVRFTGRFNPPKDARYAVCLWAAGGKAKLSVDGRVVAEVDATGVSARKKIALDLSTKGHSFSLEYSRTRGYAAVRLGWELVDSEESEKALELAKTADAVVFFADVIEGEEEDRAALRLPKSQEVFIERLLDANRNVVVVLMTGSPVVGEWLYRVPAVVQAWYPGEEGGRAIADVLFGDYNPAGRLPFTWPHCEGQLPLYYNMKPSGRVYDYVNATGAPLYPFGHGLSYTKFEYSNLRVEVDKNNWTVKVSFDVENAGERDGDEVVQLYVRDAVSRIARPIKELKRFKRIHLKKGEKTTVTFTLEPDDFAYYDEKLRRFVEPGEFELLIGSSSEDIRLKATIAIDQELRSKPFIEAVAVRKLGGKAVIEVEVKNKGPVADLIPFKLDLDGKEIESCRIYLEPGESRKLAFTAKAKPGTHEVKAAFGESSAKAVTQL